MMSVKTHGWCWSYTDCGKGVYVTVLYGVVPTKYDYSILIVPVLPDVVSVADESELISRCNVLLPDRAIGKRGVEPYVVGG